MRNVRQDEKQGREEKKEESTGGATCAAGVLV
jgi:hypothetical protein